ncbi:MAG TPA: GNAT family N-acetyltransferase [Actinomycetota bacterium]|nr:GNAT family N-acetyltransferase [Actinomycetota bacterium]
MSKVETTYQIELFDPQKADRAAWERHHAFRRAVHALVRPDDPVDPDELEETRMKREDPFGLRHFYSVTEGDRAIGFFGWGVMKPEAPGYESNKEYIWGGGEVLPEARRRGIGREGLTLLRDDMIRYERTLATLWGVEEEDGHAALRHVGAEEKTVFAENRLDLRKLDWDMVESWIAQGRAKSEDLELKLFEDELPEEFFEEYAPILSDLLMTMPFDDLEHGDIVVTPETLKDDRDRMKELGAKHHTLIARKGGRLAGMTDVKWSPAKPAYIDQRFTGVHPEFRGRGLGKLLKAYMLDFLRTRYDGLVWVITGNAHSNDPMLAINHALGFTEYKPSSAYQIDLEALNKYLES